MVTPTILTVATFSIIERFVFSAPSPNASPSAPAVLSMNVVTSFLAYRATVPVTPPRIPEPARDRMSESTSPVLAASAIKPTTNADR